MLTELKEQPSLVYTPAYEPYANRIECLGGSRHGLSRIIVSERIWSPARGCDNTFSDPHPVSRRHTPSYRQSFCATQGCYQTSNPFRMSI
jgi:hypothetical protein